MRPVIFLSFVVFISFAPFNFIALPATAEESQQVEDHSLVLSQETPRQSMKVLLASLSGTSAHSLSESFDMRESLPLKNIDLESLLVLFPKFMDQYGQLIPLGLISNSESGSEEFNLAPEFEQVGIIKVGKAESVPILLERIRDDSGRSRWLISQKTMMDLDGLDFIASDSRINKILPSELLVTKWRGAFIGQWIAVMILAVASMMFGYFLAKFIKIFFRKFLIFNNGSKFSQVLQSCVTPLSIIVGVTAFVLSERYLEISILIRQDLSIVTLTAVWVAAFIFIWSLIDNLSSRGEDLLRKKNRVGELSIVVFLRASAKVFIVAIAFILVLGSNGVDVTTGLAALGIGGIALALGAQKAIENFVGSIIIVTDQPIRVGDFCRIGDVVGVVESFGLRSTRVRTLDDTVVTFPNGLLASERIENYTLRKKFLLRTTLNLRYETKVDDLKAFLNDLRECLMASEYTSQDKMRVRFVNYGACSLEVEVFCYIYADNYDVFLERKENILFEICSFVEKNNSGFAFPSQTLYLSKDSFDACDA